MAKTLLIYCYRNYLTLETLMTPTTAAPQDFSSMWTKYIELDDRVRTLELDQSKLKATQEKMPGIILAQTEERIKERIQEAEKNWTETFTDLFFGLNTAIVNIARHLKTTVSSLMTKPDESNLDPESAAARDPRYPMILAGLSKLEPLPKATDAAIEFIWRIRDPENKLGFEENFKRTLSIAITNIEEKLLLRSYRGKVPITELTGHFNRHMTIRNLLAKDLSGNLRAEALWNDDQKSSFSYIVFKAIIEYLDALGLAGSR